MRPHTKLFEALREPTDTWYADAPPLMGGVPAKLSIAAFTEKINRPGFVFSENFYLAEGASIPGAASYHNRPRFSEIVESQFFNPTSYYDNLVVCNMGEFGHGVFARKAIPAGSIVAFYAGVVASPQSGGSPYSLSVFEKNKTASLVVDAVSVGGIARFFQHLPSNSHNLAEDLVKYFRTKPESFERYFLAKVEEDGLTPSEYAEAMAALKYDLAHEKNPAFFKGMFTEGSKMGEGEWEMDNLVADRVIRSDMAYANIEQFTLVINSRPVVGFYSSRAIAEGEQLGFNYGLGYWVKNSRVLPRYFSKKGVAHLKEACPRSAIPVDVSTSLGSRVFFYSKAEYEAEITAQRPKIFHGLASPLSFFGLRKKLVAESVLTKEHDALSQQNSFILGLKKLFPEHIQFELYWQNPEDSKKRYHVDVYCKAESGDAFSRFLMILQSSIIRDHVTCFKETLEIVIRGVNGEPAKMHDFIRSSMRLG